MGAVCCSTREERALTEDHRNDYEQAEAQMLLGTVHIG